MWPRVAATRLCSGGGWCGSRGQNPPPTRKKGPAGRLRHPANPRPHTRPASGRTRTPSCRRAFSASGWGTSLFPGCRGGAWSGTRPLPDLLLPHRPKQHLPRGSCHRLSRHRLFGAGGGGPPDRQPVPCPRRAGTGLQDTPRWLSSNSSPAGALTSCPLSPKRVPLLRRPERRAGGGGTDSRQHQSAGPPPTLRQLLATHPPALLPSALLRTPRPSPCRASNPTRETPRRGTQTPTAREKTVDPKPEFLAWQGRRGAPTPDSHTPGVPPTAGQSTQQTV